MPLLIPALLLALIPPCAPALPGRPSKALHELMEAIFSAQKEEPNRFMGVQRKPCGFVPAHTWQGSDGAQLAQLHAAATAAVAAELARCSAGSMASSAAGEQRREYLEECQAKLEQLVVPPAGSQPNPFSAAAVATYSAGMEGRGEQRRRAGGLGLGGHGVMPTLSAPPP